MSRSHAIVADRGNPVSNDLLLLLKNKLHAGKIPQHELASELGMAQSRVCDVLNGRTGDPVIRRRVVLAAMRLMDEAQRAALREWQHAQTLAAARARDAQDQDRENRAAPVAQPDGRPIRRCLMCREPLEPGYGRYEWFHPGCRARKDYLASGVHDAAISHRHHGRES